MNKESVQGRGKGKGCLPIVLGWFAITMVVSQLVLAPAVIHAIESGTGAIAQLVGTAADHAVTGVTAQSMADAVAAYAPLIRLFLFIITGPFLAVAGGFSFAGYVLFGPKKGETTPRS